MRQVYAGINFADNVTDMYVAAPNAMVGQVKEVYAYPRERKKFIPSVTWSFNPYDVRSVSSKSTDSSGRCYKSWDRTVLALEWSGCLSSHLVPSFRGVAPAEYYPDERAVNCALINAAEKLNVPEADYGVMIAELGETLGMLANPFNGIRKLVRKVQKRRAHAKDWADSLSSQWLEYRYGLSPFLSDIETVLKHRNGLILGRLKGTNYRASGKFIEVKTCLDTPLDWRAVMSSGLRVAGTHYSECNRFVTCHIPYTPVVDYCNTGLLGRDLPSILWEKVPYSFVVDWMVDVGSWLRAIQVNPNIVIHGNTVFAQEQVLERYVAEYACNQVGTTPISQVVGDSWSSSQFKGYRYVNLALPVVPQVNVNFDSFKRKIDSLSLTWQKIAKAFGPPRRVKD